MLITLEDKDKLATVDQIDSLVCAEVPDEAEDPVLHKIVKENMIHGPCDQGRFQCNESGRCNKNFPKQFRDATVLSEDVSFQHVLETLSTSFRGIHFIEGAKEEQLWTSRTESAKLTAGSSYLIIRTCSRSTIAT